MDTCIIIINIIKVYFYKRCYKWIWLGMISSNNKVYYIFFYFLFPSDLIQPISWGRTKFIILNYPTVIYDKWLVYDSLVNIDHILLIFWIEFSNILLAGLLLKFGVVFIECNFRWREWLWCSSKRNNNTIIKLEGGI